jgi:hypothetical protein
MEKEQTKYWSESGSLISKEEWEKEQAKRFPAFARDLAKQKLTPCEAARADRQARGISYWKGGR